MIKNFFCCDSFYGEITNVGQKGFSILIKMNLYNKSFFFVQQYRNQSNDTILHIGQAGIKFCPWCGCDLRTIIDNNPVEIWELYEENKKFLLEA